MKYVHNHIHNYIPKCIQNSVIVIVFNNITITITLSSLTKRSSSYFNSKKILNTNHQKEKQNKNNA